MQAERRVLIKTEIGLRTLNARLQAVKVEVIGTLASVPPIVLLDALWVTVLLPSGRCQTDRLGRRRPVKQRRQVPVLLALGVWPRSGQWQVLDWELADQEDQAAWERLLARLEARGLYAERGLRLLVHDGGSGLRAALRLIYPQVPHQRCVFHKLRNLWQAILMDEPLAPRQALAFKTRLIRQAAAIYRAPDEPAARALADRFAADWRAAQPDLVATLQRDFDDTLRFYALLARFPDWRPQSLRTTSLLERLNRTLRRIFRAASAYHSLAGLHRAIAHTLAPFFAP
jgi:transposase-like protein